VGAPSYSDPYLYQGRLNDYRKGRCRISLKYLLIWKSKYELVWKFKELSLGLEIFNLFNNQNAIKYMGSGCVLKNNYAIPNYMTTVF
jgi:hypothetical protein